MAVTWDETIAESRAEGRVEGLVEGKIEAAQGADLRAARRRFGALPPAFEEKIRAAEDLDHLYEILDQILEAQSIDEIDLN